MAGKSGRLIRYVGWMMGIYNCGSEKDANGVSSVDCELYCRSRWMESDGWLMD